MSRSTIAWLLLAAASVAAFVIDGRGEADAPPVVDVRTGARPLLDAALRGQLDGASVHIERPGRPTIEIVANEEGATVLEDGRVAGPADADAVEALFEDLRQTRVRRTIPADALGEVVGTISLVTGGDRHLRVEFGEALADGARAARLDDGTTVALDPFAAPHVDADVRSYLLRRLLPVAPDEVVRIDVGPSTLRFDDGFYVVERDGLRLRVAGPAALAAIRRIVEAPMTDLAPPAEEGLPPRSAIRVEAVGGRTFDVGIVADGCGAEGVLAVRGPGYRGCVDAKTFDPFDAIALCDRRLLPARPGQVVRVASDGGLRLSRRPHGGWVAERDDQGTVWQQSLSESRVYAYLERLTEAHLDPTRPVQLDAVDARIEVTVDGGGRIALECGRTGCRREGEPAFALVGGDVPALVPDPDRLRTEVLATFRPDDVVSIRVSRAAPDGIALRVVDDGRGMVLQSPSDHPFAADAVDPLRVEAMLGVLSSLRGPDTTPRGRIAYRYDIGLVDGRTLRIDVDDTCVAAIDGRGVELSNASCAAVTAMPLYPDPLRDLLRRADTVRVSAAGWNGSVGLARAGQGGAGADDAGTWRALAGEADHRFTQALARVRAAAAFRGDRLEPHDAADRAEVVFEADVAGRTVRAEFGPGGRWVRFGKARWRYAAEGTGSATTQEGRRGPADEGGGDATEQDEFDGAGTGERRQGERPHR